MLVAFPDANIMMLCFRWVLILCLLWLVQIVPMVVAQYGMYYNLKWKMFFCCYCFLAMELSWAVELRIASLPCPCLSQQSSSCLYLVLILVDVQSGSWLCQYTCILISLLHQLTQISLYDLLVSVFIYHSISFWVIRKCCEGGRYNSFQMTGLRFSFCWYKSC